MEQVKSLIGDELKKLDDARKELDELDELDEIEKSKAI